MNGGAASDVFDGGTGMDGGDSACSTGIDDDVDARNSLFRGSASTHSPRQI